MSGDLEVWVIIPSLSVQEHHSIRVNLTPGSHHQLIVTFNPVRRAARSLADRLVYGRRATSYEVLADFSEHMAETYATDEVLQRIP